jgi:methylphosphotriester-DNA--protein-cysteine methyltransferase
MIVGDPLTSLYYFPWCSGAQQLSAQEKKWFQSEKAAQRAGYSPAKNCRGLGSASDVQ